MFCPKCHAADIIKSGFISGKQRYKCCTCNYHFTHNSKGVKAEQKRIAFHLYLEGYSMREISRILGVSDVAVGKWIRPVKSHATGACYQLDTRLVERTVLLNCRIRGNG